MKKSITKVKKRFSDVNIQVIERAFVSSYIKQHAINIESSVEICRFLEQQDYSHVEQYITDTISLVSLDELVVAFECLVDDSEKKNNGVVYTPKEIRDYIIHETIKNENIPKIIDPACGCGAFLISVASYLHEKYQLSYCDIYKNYIWGCDIDEHSIEKCKVLMELQMCQEGATSSKTEYQLLVGNALEILDSPRYKNKYDAVVGNPPYVRSKNIELKVKESINGWSVVTGNVDIYIPFYQIGIELLNADGRMGYISPNTFLQSVNGRGLRNYIRNNNYNMRIVNFRDSQRFNSVTHYTCISIVEKGNVDGLIKYAVFEKGFDECVFTDYRISDYPDNAEWRFGNNEIDHLIYKIEKQPDKLDNYNIRNGLATLCNDLFFFSPIYEDDKFYFRMYNEKEYKLEKEICINIAKPNIMRSENDLISKGEKAIFPYEKGAIISEDYFVKKYPCAYAFLKEYQSILNRRDKGKTEKYPAWYAYGRTQGMRNVGSKILIPYMADRGVAVISEDADLLFYCGYAAFSEDLTTLKILKLFVESDVFWFYIKMTSKPYSKGYMALAKNYIKNFGLPELSEKQKSELLKMDKNEREEYIAKLYDLDYKTICGYIKISA